MDDILTTHAGSLPRRVDDLAKTIWARTDGQPVARDKELASALEVATSTAHVATPGVAIAGTRQGADTRSPLPAPGAPRC